MLDYNEIKERKYIIYENDPYEVLSSQVTRKQANKPVNRTKLRNLITGRVVENTFHVSDKVHEADISKREIKYLYTNKGEYWFNEIKDPSKRFMISENVLGDKVKFLKENTEVDALTFTSKDGEAKASKRSSPDASEEAFREKIIGIKMPIKVELKVTEAPPSIKGNTASGGNKQIILETGAVITAPLFIEEGQMIIVNTDTSEYVSRVDK
ncbi:hypothetical protein COB64_00030 [Candidatus Wolfebacteria bacterium]|nr:MAG: hypothetical protein COB64_00030 [Candidatus Wolfebacteria bacterium]